tara:strand:- start:4608 stop:4844 length:237 start_codon:yes stop_codon:yes gene_type:complete
MGEKIIAGAVYKDLIGNQYVCVDTAFLYGKIHGTLSKYGHIPLRVTEDDEEFKDMTLVWAPPSEPVKTTKAKPKKKSD